MLPRKLRIPGRTLIAQISLHQQKRSRNTRDPANPRSQALQNEAHKHVWNRQFDVAARQTPQFSTPPDQTQPARTTLERNRLTASRCRQKRKEHTHYLETQSREEVQKKRHLEGNITMLQGEILALKNAILKHATRIERHLVQMMQQMMQGNPRGAGASSSSVSASSFALSPGSGSLAMAAPSAVAPASLPGKSVLKNS